MRISLIPSPYAIEVWWHAGGTGPRALLDAGLERLLKDDGHDVACVERQALGAPTRDALLTAHLGETALLVRMAAQDHRLPIVLGGDCLVAIAVLAAAQSRTAVAYFDAHGDFNDEEISPSGYLPGMPLAAVSGRSLSSVTTGVGLTRFVDASDITLLGVRDLDPKERAVLDGLPVKQLQPSVVGAFNPAALPTYLHVDLDVLDPSVAPAVTHPAPGGLGVETVITAARKIATLAFMSVTTLVGDRDPDKRTTEAAMTLIRGVLRSPARA
jgi:arginase